MSEPQSSTSDSQKEAAPESGNALRVCPLTGTILKPPFSQEWAPKGYPIVDGKYFDGQTGKVITLSPDDKQRVAGPAQVAVWWHNQTLAGKEDIFRGVTTSTSLSVTEYVVRVCQLLAREKCTLHSLTATTYSVNVVVFTDLSMSEMDELFKECNMLYV